MELRREAWEQYQVYLAPFDTLMADRRMKTTFAKVIQGVIGSESLCASRIARFSPQTSPQ
ncbi:MAG: hypothetical protein CUN53_02010 [Phototrophicales bacterium]|nr:MAG: hypothetical protein CUN53_02010 [Phototrophicales bacterium]